MDCYYYLKITTLFAENVVAVVMIMFSYIKKKTITLWLKGVKTMDFPFVIVKISKSYPGCQSSRDSEYMTVFCGFILA